jgi:hypothetical protein
MVIALNAEDTDSSIRGVVGAMEGAELGAFEYKTDRVVGGSAHWGRKADEFTPILSEKDDKLEILISNCGYMEHIIYTDVPK